VPYCSPYTLYPECPVHIFLVFWVLEKKKEEKS
jgi:hypothetical protein